MTATRVWMVGAFFLLVGCGRTVTYPVSHPCVFDRECPGGLRCVDRLCRVLDEGDGGKFRGALRFGERCDAGSQCESDRCVGGPAGPFCTRDCDGTTAACPDSYVCKQIAAESLCAIAQPLLCQNCKLDSDCGASGADKCLVLDGGVFCGRDCTFEGCPSLYQCAAMPNGAHQCIPQGKTCDCLPVTLGLQKGCRGARNTFGACPGNQTCQVDGGFTSCNAPVAMEEMCNGVDDDCNGSIDDFTPPPCSRTVNGRTCVGPQRCLATAGLVCAASEPGPEVCNRQDDDCNGIVDDGFQDGGVYGRIEHCGECGNDCRSIPHATSTECRASSCAVLMCESGFFPWPIAAPTQCLALLDTLCRPCGVDSDCIGNGSKCLTLDGAKVCGRGCGPGSSLGPCPTGYSCSATHQCTPVTGTCTCRASTVGATRSCNVSVCKGFEKCQSSATWSACDVNSFNPEICDGKDNNCDLQVDEGFRNPVTGRYDAAAHCGFCNNDCTKYFSPALQHTTGVCDTLPAMPVCTRGPCLTEIIGATTFEWVDVDGLQPNGCECRRVQGNTTNDLPDRGPTPGASWVDENCDGVDGVTTDAIFVSMSAAAGGNGTRTAPLQTIAAGLAAQQAQGKKYVLVAQGSYRESLRLFDGAQLFGGYSNDFLKRNPQVHLTAIVAQPASSMALAAIHAESLGNGAVDTVVSGFTLVGLDASGMTPDGQNGPVSMAVYLKDTGPRFVLQNNDVIGGRGGEGGRGLTGSQGFGRQASTALDGVKGIDSVFFMNGSCFAGNARAGGQAGTNASCGSPSTNGTFGGGVVCPTYTFAGNQGAQQAWVGLPAGSRQGRGGWDWSFDTMSGFQCSHVTESGFPSTIQPHDGADGLPGADGLSGSAGTGAPPLARNGSVVNAVWVAAPGGAAAGTTGGVAEGGGGGGAGGGVARFSFGCMGWEMGATGGGGAAGGCGGSGGKAGGAGGASIGIFIARAGPGGGPTISGNRIQRGRGGDGGFGGFGGAVGNGGSGGFGGLANRWSSSTGGKGGVGGNGGPGGGGGGGAGGASYAVGGYDFDPGSFAASNTFLSGAAADTGGKGGAGGTSLGGVGSTGTAGTAGAFVDVFRFVSCAPGCAAGFSCDANSVCVPN